MGRARNDIRRGAIESAFALTLAVACAGSLRVTMEWARHAGPGAAPRSEPRLPERGPVSETKAERDAAGHLPRFDPPRARPDETEGLDPESWRFWWLLNREPYLALRAAIHSGGVQTGSDTFFLGHGQGSGPRAPSSGGGGGGGPVYPAPSGPSTPGPSSPGPSSGGGGAYRGPGDSIAPGRGALAGGAQTHTAVPLTPIEDLDALFGEVPRGLSPEELEALVAERVRRVLQSSRPRPDERPGAMFFRQFGDNPFELARLDPLSTFAADVDTASYTLARRYLQEGFLPEKAQVRTEEFVNYFRPDLPGPREGVFAARAELAPSRFGNPGVDEGQGGGGQRWMLRVAVRGREVSRAERQPLALTFVIDTSGSMADGNRLELVKHSLRLLAAQLDARDSIGIVSFSASARLVLPATSAAQRGLIESALSSLSPDGGTNAEAGLKLGYELAGTSLSRAARSRVVFLSDGVANIGVTDQDRINADVRRQRQAGVYLNTVGVGMGNHNDAFLEQLADKGDGLCNYVDGELEARRALVDNFTGAFEPIARDVKLQVEFDSAQVFRYRLLGYENRAVADQDFRNDAVDAGEVGAGHQVVALYELELLNTLSDSPLATVRLRWKRPSGAERSRLEDAAQEDELPVMASCATSWQGSSAGFKRSVLVAQFAELLRQSVHARGDSFEELLVESSQLARELSDPDFTEFVALLARYETIAKAHVRAVTPYQTCVDEVRRHELLRAQCDELQTGQDSELAREIERRGLELEQQLHGLLRDHLREELR